MTDLACRNIAGGAPVLHSSRMAACCRTSPCADGKASTPFLGERRLVSKVRMVRARVQRGGTSTYRGQVTRRERVEDRETKQKEICIEVAQVARGDRQDK